MKIFYTVEQIRTVFLEILLGIRCPHACQISTYYFCAQLETKNGGGNLFLLMKLLLEMDRLVYNNSCMFSPGTSTKSLRRAVEQNVVVKISKQDVLSKG